MAVEERRLFADLNVFKYTEWYLFYSSVTKASLNRDQGISQHNPLKHFVCAQNTLRYAYYFNQFPSSHSGALEEQVRIVRS